MRKSRKLIWGMSGLVGLVGAVCGCVSKEAKLQEDMETTCLSKYQERDSILAQDQDGLDFIELYDSGGNLVFSEKIKKRFPKDSYSIGRNIPLNKKLPAGNYKIVVWDKKGGRFEVKILK